MRRLMIDMQALIDAMTSPHDVPWQSGSTPLATWKAFG
jgi:hypothetical protein